MIRFLADTWRDAILRPVAMAAPNSSVYIEIAAPDFRFAIALVLAVLVLISNRKTRHRLTVWLPTLALFALVFLSFIPWMQTTGNGRYFMPYLILIGPLCIALINLMQNTVGMKIFLVAAVLGIQGFALNLNNPWRSWDAWTWIPWKDAPYLSLELPKEGIDPHTTYVTIAVPTFSLAAPLLPASSRWINLATFGPADEQDQSPIYAPIRKTLRESRSLKLFMAAAPRSMLENSSQPDQYAINAITPHLEAHDLKLKIPTECQLLRSKSMVHRAFFYGDETPAEKARIIDQSGFWICSIEYSRTMKKVTAPSVEELNAKVLFEKMEKICPRFFNPGQQHVKPRSPGFYRRYGGSDSFLIATKDGYLYFKYDRALNPQLIEKAEEVLSPGFTYDCTKFKGRAGLPWEREI